MEVKKGKGANTLLDKKLVLDTVGYCSDIVKGYVGVMNDYDLPSGKRLHNYGKIHHF